jgi:hypothetical protein
LDPPSSEIASSVAVSTQISSSSNVHVHSPTPDHVHSPSQNYTEHMFSQETYCSRDGFGLCNLTDQLHERLTVTQLEDYIKNKASAELHAFTGADEQLNTSTATSSQISQQVNIEYEINSLNEHENIGARSSYQHNQFMSCINEEETQLNLQLQQRAYQFYNNNDITVVSESSIDNNSFPSALPNIHSPTILFNDKTKPMLSTTC